MTEVALKPCPMCGDPMRVTGQLFQHTLAAEDCILLAHAWPFIPAYIAAWNTRKETDHG